MHRTAVVLALPLVLLAAGCGGEPELTPEETTLTVVGQEAPPFRVETLAGETFDLESQRGRVVLINFFATWCPPCREELPHLEREVWQRFRDEPFALVVIGREEDEEVLRPFIDQHDFTFPVAGDPDRSVYGQYASQYIPRNVVVGPGGRILFQSQGFGEQEFAEMIAVIEEALAGLEGQEEGAAAEAA